MKSKREISMRNRGKINIMSHVYATVAAVVNAECMQGDNFPRTRRTTIDN